MKNKKTKVIFSALTFSALALLAAGVVNSKVSTSFKQAKAVEENVVTDYGAFSIRNGSSGTVTSDTENNKITYTGAWDSNFAVTDQFDTRSGNYSLKAHVYSSSWTIGSDMGTGFTIYYNDDNYMTFYLKWADGTLTNSITEGVWLNHVGGNTDSVYQSAVLPSGSFATRSTFTDVWSDGAWTSSVDGSSINLRTGSQILVSQGFDMTMYVERSTYSNRLVDIVYFQVDAYAADGTTPLTAYTPRYAIDAMTNPLGAGESAMANRKPNIGFMQFNMSNIEYSDIVFTDKNTEKVSAKITRTGAMPQVGTVDAENDTISYANSSFASGFMMADFPTTATGLVDVQATVSGTNGNANDTQLGFTYYFNSENYVTMYLKWDGSAGTIADFVYLFTVGGSTANVTSLARDPWETSYAVEDGFYDNFSDYGGWITDSQEAMGTYGNFNNFRSQSALTIASGFTFGLKRVRTTYSGRLVDAFQAHVTAKGSDGVLHNWYTAILCADAFTNPNGGDASEFVNVAPQIGFYGCNIDTVTLSNIKYNGKDVEIDYSNRELARQFNDSYMHFADVSKDIQDDTGACRGTNGYYAKAKAAWNELSADVRTLFATDSEFSDGAARLSAWARANGEQLDDSYALVAQSSNYSINMLGENNNFTIIIVVGMTILGLATLSSVIYFRRKRTSK